MFCWWCGSPLIKINGEDVFAKILVDNQSRTVHKRCKEPALLEWNHRHIFSDPDRFTYDDRKKGAKDVE